MEIWQVVKVKVIVYGGIIVSSISDENKPWWLQTIS